MAVPTKREPGGPQQGINKGLQDLEISLLYSGLQSLIGLNSYRSCILERLRWVNCWVGGCPVVTTVYFRPYSVRLPSARSVSGSPISAYGNVLPAIGRRQARHQIADLGFRPASARGNFSLPPHITWQMPLPHRFTFHRPVFLFLQSLP